ncbi:hypothetical protein UK15_02550 [Streptomyces variegatus]|jgi:hypothetical protein|uniref:Uncharacterized protein n=1 Tax=Streptomyces variegatus TaxID=284040 RepID=A0A0M2H0Y8_9ACTN|nr:MULTISPECIES: hypothetical protein [Streptomyces]KJK41709.1 hypothetical protein UK15_02550 [Streptomyces variegatus]
MCALPVRRIASGALCAALLVGITGPVAMAAESTRGHGHVAPEARLPGTDARLAQIGKLNWGELTPVADLLRTVLRDSNGKLPPAEARRLGAAAKAALADAAAKGAQTSLMSTAVRLPAPAWPAAVPAASVSAPRAANPVTDLLDLVLGAVDGLLKAITSGVGGVLPSVDDLLTGVDGLLAALTAGDPQLEDEPVASTPADEPSSESPGTSSTSAPAETAVTLPEVPLLTPVLPPTS